LQQMMREDPELAQQLWIALVSKHNAKQYVCLTKHGRGGHLYALVPSRDWQLSWQSSRFVNIQHL